MWNAWERLEECLYFYRRHALALAMILLPVAVPAFLLKHFRAWWALGWDETLIQQDGLLVVLELLVGLFASAVTIAYAARALRGEQPAPAVVRREAVMVLPNFFLVQMLVAFAALGGFLFLILPGFWILACLMPAYVFVVADKLPVMQALQQSFRVFRPAAWQLLGTLALALLLMGDVLLLVIVLTYLVGDLPSVPRMIAGAGLDVVTLLTSQLIPIVLVRFHDQYRQAA